MTPKRFFSTLFLYSFIITGTFSQSFVVNEKRIDYGVEKDGKKGMMIHLDMNVKGMKDKDCKLYLLFEDIDGNRLLNSDGEKVKCTKKLTPSSVNSHYSDFKIFVPYSKHNSKNFYLKARVADVAKKKYIEGYQYIHVKRNDKSPTILAKGKLRKEQKKLPNGGYEVWYYNSQRAVKVYKKEPCFICGGTKICKICNGARGRWGRAYGGTYYPCRGCFQTGVCNTCFGKGYNETVTIFDDSGQATLYTAQGVFYSGRGSSSNENSSDTRSNRQDSEESKPEYFDMIHYDVPNYTGQDNSTWCEDCHKYTIAHRHQRIRIK